MRGKKSPMIMGLIGAMLLSTNAFAAVPSDFSDFPTDWSAPAMTHAVQNGLLNGSDGKILPKGLLTRAQMATMVNRAFASSAKASLTSFTDMVPGVWHYDEMAKSVQMGAFQGADGKLSPNDPITREQAFAVLARAFGLADGKASSLEKFSDGAQVSSWARGAVAALVEQGYVTGADGALNPQSYITRAEFAQVMDALVAAYADQDLKDQTVEGNLILRSNNTLENVTVKGDLILADGVSAASLKNVTVTGRLVVRGGTDGVSLTKSTPKKGIQLANPNGTPKVTVDGKAYVPTGLPGGGSNGGGGSSSGGSSGGGSNSSGGGSSSGGNSSTTQGTIVNANKTEVIATDAGTWLPLVFENGYTKDNTTVTVDGKNVTAYVTNVTTEGTIAKLPLVAEPGTVTLTSGGKTQTIVVNQTAPATSAVYTSKEGYLPDYYLAHTPLALWDYYLTNYDDEGNARVLPKQTTFSTTSAKNQHPSYSPVTVLDEAGNGNVVIMFNYKNSAAQTGDEAWFDGIAEEGALQLVQYDQYKTVRNDHLTYTKGPMEHGGIVGALTIPFNQDNFRSNGRYYVRVASTVDGKTSYALVPIHVVNHDAPEFAIQETPESGRNLHFSVKNMVYGIADPVEEVTLTKPDKTTVTLNKIDDYYLISQNLFVLYNDTTATNGKNHLDQKGAYVLTVKANGFRDAVCKFNVNDGKEVETPAAKAMRSYGIDVISGASTNIGGSDSSSSGGGYAVSADLLFDSDLLANALVLEKVGAETSAASTVLDYWKINSVHDAVFNTGDTKYYPIGAYISAVNTAQTEGTKWLPFASYRGTAEATANQPHATKAVLEDGLLGDLQDSSTSGKLDFVEAVVSNNQQGKDVVLTFSGDDATAYLTKINEDGLVYLNGDWRELGTDKYTVDLESKTITFDANCFTIGKNTIRLKSAGYKVQDVTVDYSKVNENVTGLTVTQTDGVVNVTITGSTDGDFLKNLKSITLTKDGETDTVWAKGVEGSDAVYYVVADNYKSVDLYNMKPGTYTVSIEANYYEDTLTTNFTVASSGDVELKPVPNENPTVSLSDTIYKLNFGSERATKDWQDKVTSVTVNGNEYTKCGTYGSLTSNGYKLGDITGYSSVELWIEGSAFTAVNKLVIQADGYETLTLKINKNGSLVTDGEVTPPATVTVPTEAPSITKEGSFLSYYKLQFSDTAKAWLEKVNGITVNTKQYTKTTGSASSSYYSIDVDNAVINLGDTFRDGLKNTVVISADGCVDLKLKIESTDAGLTATIVNDNGSTETKNVPQYTWSSYSLKFEPSDDVADYLDAVTEVKIGSKELRATTGDWAFSGYYAVNVKSNDCTIYFSSSDFSSEEAVVSIKAEGYADLTFKVKDGQLVTDNNSGENPGTSGVTVPSTAPTISSDVYIRTLTFEGYEAWVEQISAIKVDGTSCTKATSVNNLNDKNQFATDSERGIVYLYLRSDYNKDVTYSVVISAGEGTKDLTLTVTIPSGFFSNPTVEIVNN